MEAGDGLMFNEYLLDLDSSLGSDTIYEESVSRDVDSFSVGSGLFDTRVTPLEVCTSEEPRISVLVFSLSGISELSSLNTGFDGSYDVCDTDEDVSE